MRTLLVGLIFLLTAISAAALPALEEEDLNVLLNLWMRENETQLNYYLGLRVDLNSLTDIERRVRQEAHFIEALPESDRPKVPEDLLSTESETVLLDYALENYSQERVTSPSQSELRDFYESHQALFASPEMRTLRYVTFRVGSEANSEDAALKLAQDFSERVKKSGESFEVAADRHWGGQKNKGRVGPFPNDPGVGPFVQTAFRLKPGEISEPIRSKLGYHIFCLEAIQPPGIQPFDAVSSRVLELALNRLRMEKAVKWLRSMSKSREIIAPFLQMTTVPETTDTVLYAIEGSESVTMGKLRTESPQLFSLQALKPELFFPQVAGHLRQRALGLAEIRQAAFRLPRVREILTAFSAGEATRLWRKKHIKPAPPSAEDVEQFYQHNLEKYFRQPGQFNATVLSISLPRGHSSGSSGPAALGELDDMTSQVLRQLKDSKTDLSQVAQSLRPRFVQVEVLQLKEQSLDKAPKEFSQLAALGVDGQVLGPVRSHSRIIFAVIRSRTKGKLVPLTDELRAQITQRLLEERVAKEWTQRLRLLPK